ncbi:MAG: CHRD domain-containing protein [Chloroflexota bacterium]|nr:CHRD domain-containing protein [Chloroflexota bacterium]
MGATMALANPHTARAVKLLAVTIAIGMLGLGIMQALAVAPATPAFERTWARTDKPVVDGEVSRTWMWGPEANTGLIPERYAESPDGLRQVQYFDKSRMEITDPDAVDDGVWFVTNGLLVNELISGRMQIGDARFEIRAPAGNVNVAGDLDGTSGPTYVTFAELLDLPPLADGAAITQRLARDGAITNDPALAAAGVTAAFRLQAEGIDHQIASPFWEFMTSQGIVYEDGLFIEDALFENAFYATGYPIAEPYWASVKLKGVVQDVLIQCFQRRCLTYTPGNDPGWQVEAGNVGQHYYTWRYPDLPTPTPTETPTGTVTSTPTSSPTATPQELPDERLIVANLTGEDDLIGGGGVTWFYIHEDEDSIDFQIVVENLVNVTAAHIHAGGAGVNGPILVPLFVASTGTSVTPDGVLAEGTIEAADLPDGLTIVELANLMVDGEVYVNVRTTANPTGEIRGQTQPLEAARLRASLSGANEVPPTLTDASGAAIFNYDAGLGAMEFQVALNDIIGLTAVHIRAGAANENGPILATLFVTSSPQPSFTGVLTDVITSDELQDVSLEELVYLMLTGDTYVNAHTTLNPAGEIRGQIGASLGVGT